MLEAGNCRIERIKVLTVCHWFRGGAWITGIIEVDSARRINYNIFSIR